MVSRPGCNWLLALVTFGWLPGLSGGGYDKCYHVVALLILVVLPEKSGYKRDFY